MELDATFFLAAVPAVLIAAVSKGGFGSGPAFIAAPILALVLPPAQAVGVLLPLLMVMDVAGLRAWWGRWSRPQARVLMISAVPGVLLGWALFRVISADGLRLMVGGIAIGYVVYAVARRQGLIRATGIFATPRWGAGWGILAGLTSFVSHAGGPAVAIYLMSSRLSKTSYQATSVLVFWWINVLKFPPYLMLGMVGRESLLANLLLAPVAVAGIWLGVKAHHMVPERTFFGLMYALLTIVGLRLIWVALA